LAEEKLGEHLEFGMGVLMKFFRTKRKVVSPGFRLRRDVHVVFLLLLFYADLFGI